MTTAMAGQKRAKGFTNIVAKRRRLNHDQPSSEEAAITRSRAAQLKGSRLEDLPTELIQQIFLYSANYELPLVSETILKQLSDTTMISSIMKALLRPFGPAASDDPTAEEIRMVRGMFERRFFSMDLLRECSYHIIVEAGDAVKSMRASRQKTPWRPNKSDNIRAYTFGNAKHRQLHAFFSSFEDVLLRVFLCADLPAHFPSRYLRGPWNEDKCLFLELLPYLCQLPGSTTTRDRLGELVKKPRFRAALNDAVEANSLEATKLLCAMQVQVEQEHLRAAVKYSSEGQSVFSFLLYTSVNALTVGNAQAPVRRGVVQIRQLDYQDHTLWQWADEMRKAGDKRGDITMEQLKAAAEDQAVCMSYLPRRHNSWQHMPRYEDWLEGQRVK